MDKRGWGQTMKRLSDSEGHFLLYRDWQGDWRVLADEQDQPLLFVDGQQALRQAHELLSEDIAHICRFAAGPSRAEVRRSGVSPLTLERSQQLVLPGAEDWGR